MSNINFRESEPLDWLLATDDRLLQITLFISLILYAVAAVYKKLRPSQTKDSLEVS